MVWKEQWDETEFSTFPSGPIVYVNGTRGLACRKDGGCGAGFGDGSKTGPEGEH